MQDPAGLVSRPQLCACCCLRLSVMTLTCSERRPVARLTSITGVTSRLFSSDKDCKPVHCRSSTAQGHHAKSDGHLQLYCFNVFQLPGCLCCF
jgi:hypothetical protein